MEREEIYMLTNCGLQIGSNFSKEPLKTKFGDTHL